MSLKKLFRVLLGIQFTLGVGLAILTVSMFLNEAELSRSQRIHFQSYLRADELRQSSDDLTRLARTFAATGKEEFERQYWAVLLQDLPAANGSASGGKGSRGRRGGAAGRAA